MAAVIDSSQKSECRIHTDGNKFWYLNDEFHRKDGPAIECADGTKEWYLNGNLHREDGPAIEYANGNKWWCLNGKYHREDGPAIEYSNGKTRYWINGKYIPQLDNKRIYGKDNLTKYLILL